MTHQEWFAQEDKVLLFKEILSNPVLEMALGVLTEHGLPVMRPTPDGMDPLQHGALLNARREGYFEFLRNLKLLGTVPQEKEVTELRPWKQRAPFNT